MVTGENGLDGDHAMLPVEGGHSSRQESATIQHQAMEEMNVLGLHLKHKSVEPNPAQ